jgi:hypothetical protein
MEETFAVLLVVAVYGKAKQDIRNIKELNLAAVKLMTVQVTKLPL